MKCQWIPSHGGIEGKKKAGAFERVALSCAPKFRALKTSKQTKDAIRNHFRALRETPRQARVAQGLTREDATLLYRIRSNSAYTQTWSFITQRFAPALCALHEVELFIWLCPQFEEEGKGPLHSPQKALHTHAL